MSYPEIQLEEIHQKENELGRRPRWSGGSGSRYSKTRSRLGIRPKEVKRSPPSRSKPILKGLRRSFGSTAYEPYPIANGSYSDEPGPSCGSERIRWAQDCLNHAMKIQLPVTGIMGPETRSVVRNFQRQQGLRASGIIGPDTEEAIKSACNSKTAATNDTDEELENQTLGLPGAHLRAQLTWLPNNNNPRQYTLDEAITEIGGGIYIAIDTGGKSPKILKVGQASDFNTRLRKYRSRTVRRIVKGKIQNVLPDLRFYLARVSGCRGGGCGVGGLDTQIERAISRLLFRTHRSRATRPQWHHEKYTIATVSGPLLVENILPKPLIHLLNKAYTATGTDVYNQPITTYPSIPTSRSSLILDPGTNPFWEFPTPQNFFGEITLENPFSEAEELELAAELLSISNEEELDLFLGKLFKGIGRGLKKFGRFVGKKVLPALGKGLKAIGKVALPIVGRALGSFIPIPGVGTAIGGAIGTAVSKALELEFSGLPAEEAELEMARRFIRIAAAAARQAALSSPDMDEEAMVNEALLMAARKHLPHFYLREFERSSIPKARQQERYQIFEDSEFLPISPAVIPYYSQIVIDGQFYPPPAGVTVKNFFASSVPRFKRLKLNRNPAITAVVIHETGTSSVESTVSTLQAKGSGAHFIVAPDGSVTQHGDLVTDYLIHANHYNCLSVGIEVVNPYYASRIQPPWKETLTARWVKGKNYVVPTPQQAETVYKLIQWLTQQSDGRLQIPRIWIGKQDNDFAMSVTPDTGFRKEHRICGRPPKTKGILAHANIYASKPHADGGWLVLYAYLRSEHGYPLAKAYEKAIALSKNVRFKRFMGKNRGHWAKLPENGSRKLPGDHSCVRPRVGELELTMEQEPMSCKIVPIAPEPRPGFFYTIKYKVDGAGLINLARRAYDTKSYPEQLKLAQRINAHIYNQRFWVRTENIKSFPNGIISFSPRFTASIRAQADANQGAAPKGRAFATIYIPKLNENT